MRNILKAILVISAVSAGFPAMANGSMGHDVRVITVKPSRTIIRLGNERRAGREARRNVIRQNQAIQREILRVQRQRQREFDRWNREMDKKMHRERFKKKGR